MTTYSEIIDRLRQDIKAGKYDTEYDGRDAIQLPWPVVTELLGHPHGGNADDDNGVITALCIAGTRWAADAYAEGWTDENGWGIARPIAYAHIGAYEFTRQYGGPEEGGWWYDDYRHLESLPNTEANRKELEKKHSHITRNGGAGYTDGATLVVRVEQEPGEHDVGTPRYLDLDD